MSVTFKKMKHKRLQDDGTYALISSWTSSDTVELDDGTDLSTKLSTAVFYDSSETGEITSRSPVLREEDVVDNLVSTATNKPLSANQGNVLNARIDTIIEGGSTGNEELIDIRVGADGTTYSTAGEAVRTQVSALSARIDESAQSSVGLVINNAGLLCCEYVVAN